MLVDFRVTQFYIHIKKKNKNNNKIRLSGELWPMPYCTSDCFFFVFFFFCFFFVLFFFQKIHNVDKVGINVFAASHNNGLLFAVIVVKYQTFVLEKSNTLTTPRDRLSAGYFKYLNLQSCI